jgi:hypothetical protein
MSGILTKSFTGVREEVGWVGGSVLLQAWRQRWLTPTDLRPRGGVGEHQGTSAVLLDPKEELRRLRFELATAAVW